MKSNSKKLTILIIGLLIAFSLNNTLIDKKGTLTELNFPKQSAGYTESFIYVDGTATGVGAHNWTWAKSQPWCYGDGSWSTPYIIENVTINASSSPTGSGIYINNSLDVYFIIRNCTVYNAGSDIYDAGIRLQNTCNGTIIDNTCTNNGNNGITLYSSSNNNTLSGNTANNNTLHGIYLYNNCDFNTIINNTANNNTDQGIYLETDCDNNNLTDNIINDNNLHGIYLDYNCDFNNIINNTANYNAGHGIFLSNSDYSNITDNTINGNVQSGIYLLGFDHCNITDNSINGNTDTGIYLETSDYNNITDNTINDNTGHGIYLYHCEFSNVTDNAINDNTETGIHLYFNSDYNVIKNNTINRNDLGIGLYWSDSNNISGNTLVDNSWCIYENDFSAGNIIVYNFCSLPTVQEPIFIKAAATGVDAHNWTWAVSQSWCSGSGTWNDPYIIENLKIKGFEDKNGIEIWNSDVSFIIQDCLIYNSNYGIYLENVNNSRLININCSNIDWGIHLEYSNNNTLLGNTANGNDYEGIYLTESMGNILSGNTANDNLDSGIHLDTECVNNTLSGNIANNNGDSGILIKELSNKNIISGNTANHNQIGISLDYLSNNNTISGNTACNNSYVGIRLYDDCNNNTISGNTLNYNDNYGIYLDECDNNTILGNLANGNGDTGIHLNGYCNYNTISENTLNDNNDYSGIYLEENNNNNIISGNTANDNGNSGIFLEGNNNHNTISGNRLSGNSFGMNIGNSCSNNTIYGNFFLINGIHAVDNGTDNTWNSTTIGNYWDNHTGPDITPQDGIVDDPYTHIGGLAGSTDYLPVAEDGTPSITINSPSDDEVFGNNAPSYDVTIIDDYLFEMWYTLDGGLHNYTFTEFTGTIDQSAWDALSDGAITLSFYASDIPGNIESADVNIVKDDTDPIIVINSPSSGSEFGVSAPAFTITITDEHLDSMWYSLDGGVTTYAITTNATIDQTAWAALSEGSITITFYANDTLGNEASEDVIITKSIPPAGDDPTIVIVIIVVSIVGGVAVLAGVYLFMKKRGITE